MRLNYVYSTKLNGETIKHVYGYPYHIKLSLTGGKSLVLDSAGKVISAHSSWESATKKCSKLNKQK